MAKPGFYWVRFDDGEVQPALLRANPFSKRQQEWATLGSDVPYDFKDLEIVGPLLDLPLSEKRKEGER